MTDTGTNTIDDEQVGQWGTEMTNGRRMGILLSTRIVSKFISHPPMMKGARAHLCLRPQVFFHFFLYICLKIITLVYMCTNLAPNNDEWGPERDPCHGSFFFASRMTNDTRDRKYITLPSNL